jgi:capsular polysaccharide biosynthesis protein
MELRRYWKIFKRRWPLVLVPALVVLAVGLTTYRKPADVYNAGMRFLVAQPPATASNTDEQRYYNWLTSEYIVNGLTDWVRGTEFATAVSAELADEGINLPPYAIRVFPDNARSMLALSMNHSSTNELASMMAAAQKVLIEQNALPQLGGERVTIVPLDEIHVSQIPAGLRAQLDLPLRIILALAAGIGLALLAEYLDPTIRERDEVTGLGLQILGEIPKR